MFSKEFIRGLAEKKMSHATSSLRCSWILIFFCASDSMSGIVCASLMAQVVFLAVETLKVSSS